MPVQTFHGTADPVNRYSGNDDPRWGYGVEVALKRWSRLNHCRQGSTTVAATATVDLISYSKCRHGAKAVLYRQVGAGHAWPGSDGPAIGAIDQSIDASRLMWSFFARHSLADRK